MIESRLGFAFHHRLHGERPGVRGAGGGLGANPRLLRVTSRYTQLVGRVDGGIHELGELIIVDVVSRRCSRLTALLAILPVSKVNTTDETENRLSKLDASFN